MSDVVNTFKKNLESDHYEKPVGARRAIGKFRNVTEDDKEQMHKLVNKHFGVESSTKPVKSSTPKQAAVKAAPALPAPAAAPKKAIAHAPSKPGVFDEKEEKEMAPAPTKRSRKSQAAAISEESVQPSTLARIEELNKASEVTRVAVQNLQAVNSAGVDTIEQYNQVKRACGSIIAELERLLRRITPDSVQTQVPAPHGMNGLSLPLS
jgi:hypothetical protein